MDKQLNISCTICARGGSKGIPGKNILPLAGKPLIVHTIEQAQNSQLFSSIAVSSDSPEILKIAKQYGVNIIERPEELASDKAAKIPVIRHCVQQLEKLKNQQFDICVDLDCTSPLRSIDDIKGAVELLLSSSCDNVITGMASRRSPYFNLVEENSQGQVELSKKLDVGVVRRQDAPKTYDLNASIYVWKRDVLMENDSLFLDTRLYEMPEERSIDIDSHADFKYVDYLMRENEIRK